LLSLLEDGKYSDVTFVVEGELIKAHSLILCARSDVFERQLQCGMRESLSKEVEVKDCDVGTFKALLQFLYTDDFVGIEAAIAAMASESAASGSGHVNTNSSENQRISFIQGILAASHKYQVSRLRLWCEQQLCECISVTEVCSILCQAHLYEAKQLQEVCLAFIKDRFGEVAKTKAFGSLSEDWPQVMLKISIFIAGLTENDASAAIEGQQDSRQRRQAQLVTAEPTSGDKRKRTE